jgi:8-oxo-dGTP pyrophosphatase MutT (NUDIX family)
MTYNPYLTEENFFVATKVCLVHKNKILVIEESRPWKPLWMELPGWKISKNDRDMNLLQSLNREVYEELGLDIDFNLSNTELFTAYKKYEDVTFSDVPVPFIFLCYIYQFKELPDILLSHEHVSARWIWLVDLDDIHHWRPGFDTIIRKAFSALTNS